MEKKKVRLVRDKHIDRLKQAGHSPRWHIMPREEYLTALRAHFDESVAAYYASNDIEDLAEVLETVHALAVSHRSSPEELEQIRKEKADALGGYVRGIGLDEG